MPSDQRGDRFTAGDRSWGASPGTDPVSPELVLVAPPDEARRAREQLPESPAEEWDRPRAKAPGRPTHRIPQLPQPPRSRRRRWFRRTAAVGALLLLVASGVTVGLAGSRDDNAENAARRLGAAPTRPQSITSPATTSTTPAHTNQEKAPQRRSRSSTQPKAHAPAPTSSKKKVTKKRSKQKASKKRSKQPTQSRRAAPPAAVGFVPARTWSWEPEARARRYAFTLLLNGKRVYAARTAKPRFVLPKRFRFAAGLYRWRVVAVGARRKVVVDSKFRLSAAGAAAANG